MQYEDEKVNLTLADVESIAQSAADRAVVSLFEKLDIDVENKEAMRRFRDNLRYLDEQREGTMLLKQNMKKSAVYLSCTAFLGMIYFSWDIFKSGFAAFLSQLISKQ